MQEDRQSITTENTSNNDFQAFKNISHQSNRFSSVAGTKAYMAPEILSLFDLKAKPEDYKIKITKSQDVYSLGLILYEMCHKIRTNMQKVGVFNSLRSERKLKSQCPLVKGKHIEYDLIIKMTEEDPFLRPSSLEIKSKWLPLWN